VRETQIENEKLKIEKATLAQRHGSVFNFQFSIFNSPSTEAPIA